MNILSFGIRRFHAFRRGSERLQAGGKPHAGPIWHFIAPNLGLYYKGDMINGNRQQPSMAVSFLGHATTLPAHEAGGPSLH